MYKRTRFSQRTLSGRDKSYFKNSEQSICDWLYNELKPGQVLGWYNKNSMFQVPDDPSFDSIGFGMYTVIKKPIKYDTPPKPDSNIKGFEFMYHSYIVYYRDGINKLVDFEKQDVSYKQLISGKILRFRDVVKTIKDTGQVFNSKDEWFNFIRKLVKNVW